MRSSFCVKRAKSNDDYFFDNQNHRFRFLFQGDIVLTTPSLESLRLTSEPRHPYRAMLSARRSNELDQHMLLYDSLEDRRYKSLAIKQPIAHHVARIFQERCKTANGSFVLSFPSSCFLVGRTKPSQTGQLLDASQHRSASDRLPHLDQTMVSQRFNKISPFATDHGSHPHVHRQSLS